MVESDYRSEKMDSVEGLGRARKRWFGFMASLPSDALDATGWMDGRYSASSLLSAEQHREIARGAKESSELIGFWVMWHLAGGFDQLEGAGWHRATIFRKIKRFRDEFGQHPDAYDFPYLTIDFNRVWTDDFLKALGVEPSAENSGS